jgi:hypothetical protein
MSLFTEPIETEQLWSRAAMGVLWGVRSKLDKKLANQLKVLFDSRQKDSLVGSTKIKYTLSGEAGKLGFGRLYSKGFEGYENEARGSLSGRYYHDIDVVNCHPTLMWQFAQKVFEIDTPECKKFCANRQEYYDQIAETKDEAKSAMFRILYGGACNFVCLYPFKMECDSLAKRLTKHTDYAKLWDVVKEAKEEKNPLGSFLSLVLQTEERKVLLAMRQFFTDKKWSADVLCYDGLMIRKEAEDITDDTLRQCEAHIKEVTGYSIQLSEKPFSQYKFIESKEDKLIPTDVLINDSYAAAQFAKVADEELLMYYGDIYCNLDGIWTNGEKAMRSLIHKHRNSLVFKQLANKGFKIFDYGGNEKNIPSLMKQTTHYVKERDLPVQLAYQFVEATVEEEPRQQILSLFLTLVNLWSRKENLITNYLLDYFADIIQNPRRNPGVMLIITGKKGCGKDTLLSVLIFHVLGQIYSYSYNGTKQFFDFYDTGKRNKLLVRVEEAAREDCMKYQDDLKSFVTSETIEINEKHKDKVVVPNFTRYFFTTNKGNPVSFKEEERRFLLLPCSEEKVGDSAFWTEVNEKLKTPVAGKVIGEFLLSRDISNFTPRNYPKTDFQEAAIDTDKSAEQRFLESDFWDGNETTPADLFDLYCQYCIQEHLHYTNDVGTFGKRLLTFVRDSVIKYRTAKGGKKLYSK